MAGSYTHAVAVFLLFTVYCFTFSTCSDIWKQAVDDSEDGSLITNTWRATKKAITETVLNKCGEGADCFFTTGVGLCYETSGAALLISSATCDGSKLREARLMLMCHHRGLVKTWFSCLSACKEHSGWLSGHRWLPPWGCWFQTSLELRIKTKQNKKKAARWKWRFDRHLKYLYVQLVDMP